MDPKTDNLNFGEALHAAKHGRAVSRAIWPDHIKVMVQFPDENSWMTKPYLFMEKEENGELVRFPLDLSAESIFAEDWSILPFGEVPEEASEPTDAEEVE